MLCVLSSGAGLSWPAWGSQLAIWKKLGEEGGWKGKVGGRGLERQGKVRGKDRAGKAAHDFARDCYHLCACPHKFACLKTSRQ